MTKKIYSDAKFEKVALTEKRNEKDVLILDRAYSLREAIEELFSVNRESYDIEAVELVSVEYDEEKVIDNEYVLLEDVKITPVSATEIEEYVKNNVADFLNSYSAPARALALSLGYGLDKALDEHEDVRVIMQAVKKQYKLDVFKNHRNPQIRRAVAELGIYDELCEDENPYVRAAAIKVTRNEEILKNHLNFEESDTVKVAYAERDYGAEFLVNDLSNEVRQKIAENTKNRAVLEILIGEESDKVRSSAFLNPMTTKDDCLKALELNENGEYINNRYIRKNIARKAIENGWQDVMEVLAKDGVESVRMIIAESGNCRDILLKDKSAIVRKTAFLSTQE